MSRTATVEVAGHKIVLQELTFEDSLAVDSRIPTNEDGIPSGTALSKVYALASIQSIDEIACRPAASEVDWKMAISMFSAMDAFALAKAYSDAFPAPVGQALKNESSDPA